MKAVTAKKKTDGNWIPINFFFRFALQKCHWHRAAHPTPVYIYCTCRMSWVWLIWRSSACSSHWGAGVFMYCFRLVWQKGFGSASQEPFWTSAEILVRFLQSPNRNVSWEEKKWNKKATLVASPAGLQLGFCSCDAWASLNGPVPCWHGALLPLLAAKGETELSTANKLVDGDGEIVQGSSSQVRQIIVVVSF